MKRVIAAILVGSWVSCVGAGEYVDPDQKKVDLERREFLQQAYKECNDKGLKTVGEREECLGPAQDKAREKYPRRGTETYAKQKYSDLTKQQAISKLKELHDFYLQVEDNYSKRAGVVKQSDLVMEGWWIHTNILGTPESMGDPWFLECESAVKTDHIVERCPLNEGGAE